MSTHTDSDATHSTDERRPGDAAGAPPAEAVAADLSRAIGALEAVDWRHVDDVGTATAGAFTRRLIDAREAVGSYPTESAADPDRGVTGNGGGGR